MTGKSGGKYTELHLGPVDFKLNYQNVTEVHCTLSQSCWTQSILLKPPRWNSRNKLTEKNSLELPDTSAFRSGISHMFVDIKCWTVF